MSVRFSKEYKNDYGITRFSETFELTGKLGETTEKFNRRTQELTVNNENQLQLLKEQNIKIYKNNVVFIDLNGSDSMDEITVCIKKFVNLKGEVFCKLVYNKVRNIEEF